MNDGVLLVVYLLLPLIFAFMAYAAAYFVPIKALEENLFVDLLAIIFRIFAFDHAAISQFRGIFSRGLLIALGTGCLLYPAIRDYSSFFSSRFSIEVFFDQAGLDRALDTLNNQTLKQLNLESDWRSRRPKYFDRLNRELLAAGVNFQFLIRDPMTVGNGNGVVKIRKISWLFQEYKITEANGSLSFRTGDVGDDTPSLLTGYNIVPSSTNYIKQPAFSVYFPHSILSWLEFRQFVHLTPTNKTVGSDLIAATVKGCA
jgi:hypothetical protein